MPGGDVDARLDVFEGGLARTSKFRFFFLPQRNVMM